MGELKQCRMQGLSPQSLDLGTGSGAQKGRFGPVASAIQLIANQRHADRGHVNPDLMGTTGFKAATHQTCQRHIFFSGPKGFKALKMSDRHTPIPCPYGLTQAVIGMAAKRFVDNPFSPHRRAPDKSQIGPQKRAGAAMVGKLVRKRLMRRVGLGDNQKPAGVFIEAMNNSRPAHTANARKAAAAMGQKRVHQRAALMARRRMHHQTRRFFNDDNRVIFKNDIKGNGLSFRNCGLGKWDGKLIGFFRFDRLGGLFYGAARARDVTFTYKGGYPRTRDIGQAGGQETVQPQALVILGGGEMINLTLSRLRPRFWN